MNRLAMTLAALAGAAIGALGTYAFAGSDSPPDYHTECASDAVRVFVTDRGIAAIVDPDCDLDRAGLDYPSEDQ